MVLAALATWRITHLLSSEDGPGDVFFHVRALLGSSVLGRLMDCFFCLSLWVSAAAALFASKGATEWVLAWLGLSGAACLLERVTAEPAVIKTDFKGGNDHALLRPETREPQTTDLGQFARCSR